MTLGDRNLVENKPDRPMLEFISRIKTRSVIAFGFTLTICIMAAYDPAARDKFYDVCYLVLGAYFGQMLPQSASKK